MKPRDIELKLNIKNYKAGKYLHLMAIDAIEDFEKSHPKTIPLLLASLKHGDPVNSLKMASKLTNITEALLSSVSSLKENIEAYMSVEMEEAEDSNGSQYITTNGNMGFAWKQGEESIEVNLDNADASSEEKATEEKDKEEA